jgi:hypothetical protein
MRHLFIIGNGFDLAHELKTSYKDFILWYLNKVWRYVNKNQGKGINWSDGLISINREPWSATIYSNKKVKSIDEFLNNIRSVNEVCELKVEYSNLLNSIMKDLNWADIEIIYYKELVKCLKPEKGNIEELNKSFNQLKKELDSYISNIVNPKIIKCSKISAIINILDEISLVPYTDVMFVNFNYTSTLIDLYLDGTKFKESVINIHGVAGDPSNPIIFGYGDEMDNKFEDIENMDDNRYLNNMKSFGYFRTMDYKRILNFIKKAEIENGVRVHVLGHSLGLSDRLLLNTIFEHEKCFQIELHYSHKCDNYEQLIRNLSRHFTLKMKGIMREKVVPKFEPKTKQKTKAMD